MSLVTPGGDTLLQEGVAEPGGPGPVSVGDQGFQAINHLERP